MCEFYIIIYYFFSDSLFNIQVMTSYPFSSLLLLLQLISYHHPSLMHYLRSIFLCFRWDFASSIASCTAHYIPLGIVSPVLRTQSSDDIWIVMAIRALVTLNYSVDAVNGSYSFVSLPYRHTFEKEGGIPSHFRKPLLNLLSSLSTAVIGTPYIINGHRVRGSTPCW